MIFWRKIQIIWKPSDFLTLTHGEPILFYRILSLSFSNVKTETDKNKNKNRVKIQVFNSIRDETIRNNFLRTLLSTEFDETNQKDSRVQLHCSWETVHETPAIRGISKE